MLFKLFILFGHIAVLFAAENGSSCVTPNGEHALCIPIDSCKVIKKAIQYLEEDAVEFARKSQCGYDNDPLVCCGSLGRLNKSSSEADHTEINLRPSTTEHSVTPIDNSHLPDQSLCGIQRKGERIGDEVEYVDEFPWTVPLRYVKTDNANEVRFLCAGTLINQRYLITAAECLDIPGYNLVEARLGELKFSTSKDCDYDTEDTEDTCADASIDMPIVRKIPHPFYSNKSGSNNIALLLLEKKVKYTSYIRPICLPPSDLALSKKGDLLVISGWDITDNGPSSDVKRKKAFKVKANEDCDLVLPETVRKATNQVCGDVDEFYGDKGGPLMRLFQETEYEIDQQWLLEGVIVKLPKIENHGAPPIVYIGIPKYTNWIVNNLQHS